MGPSTSSLPLSPSAHEDALAAPTPSDDGPRASREPDPARSQASSVDSEVPDSQPIGPALPTLPQVDPLSEPTLASTTPDNDATTDRHVDRALERHLAPEGTSCEPPLLPDPALFTSSTAEHEPASPVAARVDDAQPGPLPAMPGPTSPGPVAEANGPLPNRFATPPVTLRRTRQRPANTRTDCTLGDFLAAATSQLRAALPCPGKRP